MSDDGNYIDLEFPDPGTYEFGYYVTNNFGCAWDTTVVIEVIPNPGTFITAGRTKSSATIPWCWKVVLTQVKLHLALQFRGPTITATAETMKASSHIVRTTSAMGR